MNKYVSILRPLGCDPNFKKKAAQNLKSSESFWIGKITSPLGKGYIVDFEGHEFSCNENELEDINLDELHPYSKKYY